MNRAPGTSTAEETLPRLLFANAGAFPGRPALREKNLGLWQTQTWADYARRVREFAMGLHALGFRRDDVLAVLADNRPEWLIAELAAQSLGGRVMGIYQDSGAEEVRYLLEFADVRFVVAEDQEQVDKLLELRAGGALEELSAAIYFDPRGMRDADAPFLHRFDDVERLGVESGDDGERALTAGLAAGAPGDVALLATTSGTTGRPKLAMLTHRNLISMGTALQGVDPMAPSDEFVSTLPLAWIGEQMISISCSLLVGFVVDFPEEPETVRADLREIGPQTMFSPPRIWESMLSEVQVRREDSSRWKRWVFDRCLEVGYAAADRRRELDPLGRPLPLPLRVRRFLAEWLCFVWLRDQLGLRRLRHAYTGGAALGPDVFRFFHAIGVNLKQIYGQTEVSGISVVHRDHDIRYETVGTPLPGTEVELAEDGEIRTRSDAVFAGYYRNEEATAETLDDGWLRSGDAGMFDEDGHLIVIDRVKDVMTLADGARFSPQFLENKLKFSPYVQEAVVFGGGDHPFVTAMITIDFANAGKWAEREQIAYTTFTDLAQKAETYTLVRDHVRSINGTLPESARIRRFLLLHKELDADDAELTRTRKVRRGFVSERYAEILRGLYSDADRWTVENEVVYQDGSTRLQRTDLRIENL